MQVDTLRVTRLHVAAPVTILEGVSLTFGAPVPPPDTDPAPGVIPIMNEILQAKGLVKVAEDKILVTGLGWKGPLEEGWQKKVEAFVARISTAPGTLRRSPAPNR